MSFDVFQNSIVGGRLPPNVMLRRQTVDRNDQSHWADRLPFERNRANRAGHELDVDPARRDLRQNLIQFTKADQWLAADDREM